MKLMVWRRMTWTDPRLSWNVTEWGGVTDLRMHPALDSEGGRPDDRLWEPDLHHYNADVNPEESLHIGATWIYPDGSIFQSRPGMLELNCRFTGLVNFPYDALTCPFDVGGWDYGDNVQNLSFYDTGIELETRMESSGTSYQVYSIKGYSVERQTYYYKCCPEPYSNLIFRITFERPARYYFCASRRKTGRSSSPASSSRSQALPSSSWTLPTVASALASGSPCSSPSR